MPHHDLKIHTEYFDKVIRGTKKAEVRKADRDFRNGDTVSLKEYLPELKQFTGSLVNVRITDVTKLKSIGIDGYCLFSFDVLEKRL